MSKELIKTEFSSFEHLDNFDNKTKILITSREYKYNNGKHYFYLDYTFHPQSFSLVDPAHQDGDIIYKNEMTTVMINYLLMDDKELYNQTGNTTVSDYKLNIIKSLSKFWD